MKQEQSNIVNIVKYFYGLENFTIPNDIKTKAFIFYTTDEEKSILEKNKIYCLSSECEPTDMLDLFQNKLKTESLVGVHSDDIKLVILLEDMKIPSLIIFKNPTIELFNKLGMNLDSRMYKMSNEEQEVLKKMLIDRLIKVGIIAMAPYIGIAKIHDDFDFSEENIHNLLTTKYNIENIFNDDFEKISNLVMNHARSSN